ncbi:MAG TPA: hypothetical protein VNG51_18300 [Ktedonobacteraceae bacterium]|nr:hypothetical protein [Ktedonobacteraceae bacterium]
MYAQSERVKLGLLCLLLLLMIGIVAFTAINTFQAVQNLQEQYSDVKSGDVSTIHPWMTIHVVAHVYNVPEDYLYHSLQIDYPNQYRHTTLYELASHKRQSVNQLISTIQHAILTYRNKHPKSLTPVTGQRRGGKPLLPTSGRTHY